MRFLILFITCLLWWPQLACAAEDGLLQASRLATMDFLMERAISRGLIAGGVVLIGGRDGIVHTATHGRLTPAHDAPGLSDRTLFDIASLTKVVATTPAVMKLLEEGRISLMDPVARWFPEFAGTGRDDITILNLLTHTSGLNDISIPADNPLKSAVTAAASQSDWKKAGNRFRYADINFILLGELVRRVSGLTLDAFCRQQLFIPLGMGSTMFLPPPEIASAIAPTMGADNRLASGVVQDVNARRLGGVAGHAGLFSSAADLARFARMLLQGGVLDDRRFFSERVVTQMTAPYFYSKGAVVRGLGWDIESPYSAPKGTFFTAMSFGHTGYSGSSIWIDPQRDLFVILLTTRLDYRDIRHFNRLRSDISTLVAAAFRPAESSISTVTP